jgi:hypothetical protein
VVYVICWNERPASRRREDKCRETAEAGAGDLAVQALASPTALKEALRSSRFWCILADGLRKPPSAVVARLFLVTLNAKTASISTISNSDKSEVLTLTCGCHSCSPSALRQNWPPFMEWRAHHKSGAGARGATHFLLSPPALSA